MRRQPSIDPADSGGDSGQPMDWCRVRYLAPGQPLALTLPYADAARRDALLALHAVIGEIAAVPGQVSDAGVAVRKLAWWREALRDRLPHPAVRALLETGAAPDLPDDGFEPLINAVAVEIDPPRFERSDELVEHAERVAGAAARLEAWLVEVESASDTIDALTALAGAGYRVRIARDLVADAGAGRWMVPLELQAEYQITRAQVAADEHSLRRDALIRHLAGDALQTIARAFEKLEADPAWRHRHALLRAELDRRLGLKIVRDPARIARERTAVTGPRLAFGLWRMARRLRRAATAA